MKAIEVGSKVAYSAAWLNSIGEHTGELPFARGVVDGLTKLSERLTIASVQWDNSDLAAAKVNVANLAIVGPNSRFCNVS